MRDAVRRAALACPVRAITVGTDNADEPATASGENGRHVVIVGASLAGLKTAEALSESGFSGQLTIIGDEPHRAYDRPPLTKACVSEKLPPDRLELPVTQPLDARFRLGVPATGLDTDHRLVRLADDATVGYDTLVIATGTGPVRSQVAPPTASAVSSPSAPGTTRRNFSGAWRVRPVASPSSVPASSGANWPPAAANSASTSRSSSHRPRRCRDRWEA
jgi:hypothetical protein